jgi:CRP-like cAMP-binding protein/Fe-S-cluster-containing hydrogenase component 2/ferredoxin
VPRIEATIDGQPVAVEAGTTIYEAARAIGILIPTVCHLPPQEPAGVCRVCVVDVGARFFTPACARALEKDMKVVTGGERVAAVRRTLVELLMADHATPCARQRESGDCELELRAAELGVRPGRYRPGPPRPALHPGWTPRDDSHPNIAVDHSACIMCDRCVRACTDIQGNDVIGRAGKGYGTVITFDAGQAMGESSCVSCGECMVSCPTGALVSKGFSEAHLPGDPVPIATVIAIPGPDGQTPRFDGISPKFLAKTLGRRNEGALVERRFRTGEVICREGEFGSTAFYVKAGSVEVSLTTPLSHVQNERRGLAGWMLRMSSRLVREPADAASPPGAVIPIDASVDLPRDRPVARLERGELFGEMTCLNFYPRSATVRAAEDTVVVEMLRPVLQILLRAKAFRAQLEATYRARALDTHLRSVPLLAGLPQDFVEHLRARVELVRCEPGQVICREGEAADGFYIVRLGFVKVSQHFPSGDLVLAYHGRGGYFGEMGLLAGTLRTATCTAVDHTEVVRLPADDFRAMLERFPAIARDLMAEAERRAAQNRRELARASGIDLEDFLGQGLMEAQSLLVLDLDRCTRCDLCVNACASAHDGVTRLVREGLRYDKYLVATSCRQCRDPLCMVGCPVGSIRRQDTLEIKIEDWCIGCGVCAENCPYGNINMHQFSVEADDAEHPGRKKAVARQKATACDLCKNLGPEREPSCVVACPHGAAIRVTDPKAFFAGRLGGGS